MQLAWSFILRHLWVDFFSHPAWIKKHGEEGRPSNLGRLTRLLNWSAGHLHCWPVDGDVGWGKESRALWKGRIAPPPLPKEPLLQYILMALTILSMFVLPLKRNQWFSLVILCPFFFSMSWWDGCQKGWWDEWWKKKRMEEGKASEVGRL